MAARTTGLIIGGVVVLGAAVALVVMLSKSSNDGAATGADSPAAKVTPSGALGSGAVRTPPRGSPNVTVSETPRGQTPADPTTDQGARDYTLGEARVHDHRSGDQKPLDVPPNIHPTESRQIPASLTQDINQKVVAVLKDCVASLPKDGRGARPRAEGQLVVAIKDKTLTVASATIVMRDLDGLGAATDTAQQCIQSHSVGLSTPAPGELDLDAYTINLSLAVH